MNVEVSGVGFTNMGAALMLAAIVQELRGWTPRVVVCANFLAGSPSQLRDAGATGVLRVDAKRLRWARIPISLGAQLAPAAILARGELIKPTEVNALLDASGFYFGDQHGAPPARRRASLFADYTRKGKPVVLLPQAFGPFDDDRVADASRIALEHADLIFARDSASLSHLQVLGLTRPIIRLAPDFTNLVKPQVTPQPRTIVIIPNSRMVEMVKDVDAAGYATFLTKCVQAGLRQGCRVWILAHGSADEEYAVRLASDCPGTLLLHPANAVEAKRAIGGATLVISSRYHGIASALSQGVPCIGTTWSHKYRFLYEDYGWTDGIWDVRDTERIETRLEHWLEERHQAARRSQLVESGSRLEALSRGMWTEVRQTIETRLRT